MESSSTMIISVFIHIILQHARGLCTVCGTALTFQFTKKVSWKKYILSMDDLLCCSDFKLNVIFDVYLSHWHGEMNNSKISTNTHLLTTFRNYFSAPYLKFRIGTSGLEKVLEIRWTLLSISEEIGIKKRADYSRFLFQSPCCHFISSGDFPKMPIKTAVIHNTMMASALQ